jgi:hypothetical protein
MLLRVRSGPFVEDNGSNEVGPSGDELWFGEVADLTVTALNDAGVTVESGEWYRFDEFAKRVGDAKPEGRGVPSTITTDHLGVSKKWQSVIEIDDMAAALMVCRSVIRHIEGLEVSGELWARVE